MSSVHPAGALPDASRPAPENASTVVPPRPSMSAIAHQHQHRSRRRKGSLRKAALLGRGAQRERRESSPLLTASATDNQAADNAYTYGAQKGDPSNVIGLGVWKNSSHPSKREAHDYARATGSDSTPVVGEPAALSEEQRQGPSYTSTTDDDDLLQSGTGTERGGIMANPRPESYFTNRATPLAIARGGMFQQTKSPLSYSGLSSTSIPPSTADWDYAETEWWGWVVLTVTWFVFVVGMGSCLDVWSWAWDVGKTPYAPPELEDDETLPIVGYYPALIILTCVMAWVWVVVAWVGMKYFRHAKISGD